MSPASPHAVCDRPSVIPAAQSAVDAPADVRRILKLSVPVTVVVAVREMPIEALLELNVGTIIEFDVAFDSDLELHVADRQVGSGQAVKVGENFGLRITAIENVRDRIDGLGGH